MKIIFHYPLPLQEDAASASAIRPVRMLRAFEELGCEVTVVAGYGAVRHTAIQKIKKTLNQGGTYDFCYSESSTQPTLLTERHHFPLYPNLDFGLFGILKKSGVPIGLFYRDIYWIFDDYGKGLHPLKVLAAKCFYRYDLFQYSRLLDRLYLPSIQMASYLPLELQHRVNALPPGHSGKTVFRLSGNSTTGSGLRLLYVGGISSHYQMHELFKIFPLSGVHLTVCTRKSEWEAVSSEYDISEYSDVSIVHESGLALDDLYANSDIGMIFVKPQEYREFAVPFKLYEYLGEGKPIIASAGTLAGKFVLENNVGWVVPYQAKALRNLLSYLLSNRDEVDFVRRRCIALAQEHTWRARAQQVVCDLTALNT